MSNLTLEQKLEYKEKLSTAAAASSRVDGGWCKATQLGSILKSIGVDYKALGYSTVRALLQDLLGPAYAERGKGPQLEYLVIAPEEPAAAQIEAAEIESAEIEAAQAKEAEAESADSVLTPERKAELTAAVYAASAKSNCYVDGWIRGTAMGEVLKEAGIMYKEMGYAQMFEFLMALYGDEYATRGEGARREYRIVPEPSVMIAPAPAQAQELLTAEQKADFRERILAAIRRSKYADGRVVATEAGKIVSEGAGINYKELGFAKLRELLAAVFGAELSVSGTHPALTFEIAVKGTPQAGSGPQKTKKDKPCVSGGSAYQRLMAFAFFPKPQTYAKHGLDFAIEKLREKALPEQWYFGDTDPGDSPVLRNYFLMTFDRLHSEDADHHSDPAWDPRLKALSNEGKIYGIPRKKNGVNILFFPKDVLLFNTGLVDSAFSPIYAVFVTNDVTSIPWKFHKFVSDQDAEHMHLARLFGNDFPKRAQYFNSTLDLVYDVAKPIRSFNWDHIIERCVRLPHAFLEDNCPSQLQAATDPDGKINVKLLVQKVKSDPKVVRRIQNRIHDAVKESLKRVEWNFKTAIPIYYPEKRMVSFLLPLSLVGDGVIDAGLVLECSGQVYIAHTILTLNMAYANARLITSPDSVWLTPRIVSAPAAAAEE